MTTYVLVHGAWMGAHGFHKVRPLLWQEGHDVFTPGLTGIGERSHLTSPQVTLTTHIQDVVNTVLYEDLDDIVLLGFSYGGIVVSGALAHIGERVRHLVFLDAFIPDDGDTLMSLLWQGTPAQPTVGATWLVPPLPRPLEDPAEQAWSDARRSPQPIGTFTEPVHLAWPLEEQPFPRTYIKATADPNEASDSAFWRAAERARTSPAWQYHEIATHHLVPLARPQELAAVLLASG
jgi:pimeloyl-ACP methyl ester carboxylesterase